ncbi:hypothetical protein PROAA_2050004 [Candidatus Propionivibrio aalborgensis]|uniref:Uncharacterized protein n=1 Tax=Candidatus Propionivibrio aalborgensis TaxID=1860101 RepID=A0A1A8XQU0_9RHOO|nr:hypothetical protein PROAA_2050004 [Candidatus Propionivibrio aalborgensis]
MNDPSQQPTHPRVRKPSIEHRSLGQMTRTWLFAVLDGACPSQAQDGAGPTPLPLIHPEATVARVCGLSHV